MVKPLIFQVVGFQNSGKTSFLKKLIAKLTAKNIKLGTIKHHGHGGKPEVIEEKDSAQHCFAGAVASLVEGDGRVLLQIENQKLSLEDQIEILRPFGLDLILVEGHKFHHYQKAVIIHQNEDLQLLDKLTNIQVLIFRDPEVRASAQKRITIPCFDIHEESVFTWFNDLIRNH